MKLIVIGVATLFTLLGLTEAINYGYGYGQSFYPVGVPYLVGGQGGGGGGFGNGGFCKLKPIVDWMNSLSPPHPAPTHTL